METLGTVLAALGRPSDSSESKSKVKEPEVFDGSDPRKLKTFFVNLALVFFPWNFRSRDGSTIILDTLSLCVDWYAGLFRSFRRFFRPNPAPQLGFYSEIFPTPLPYPPTSPFTPTSALA
ncbi:hypothetical protein F5876DRAFT_79413 [Lentinula aff. lateritia]|uniref:Uncharacterized protein n=1 Tax=Lentinula aff. lateritia TaxID=2804960 RepID=A0ACC1TT19_9AGAR|nr:hypothetical protein F5876DRAFT_79413 [Lentinula aff. lateritia]